MKTLIKKTVMIAMLFTALLSCKKNDDVFFRNRQAKNVSNNIASCTSTLTCTPLKAAMVQKDSLYINTPNPVTLYTNTNYANYPCFKAENLVTTSRIFYSHSLIKFNLPANFFNGFTFCQADLVLKEYRDPNNSSYIGFDPYTVNQSPNNSARIVRILNSWSQNTVTWNTQPLTISTNLALVPAGGTPDNQTINITNIMNDVQSLGVDRGIEILIPASNTPLAARQYGSRFPLAAPTQAKLIFHY